MFSKLICNLAVSSLAVCLPAVVRSAGDELRRDWDSDGCSVYLSVLGPSLGCLLIRLCSLFACSPLFIRFSSASWTAKKRKTKTTCCDFPNVSALRFSFCMAIAKSKSKQVLSGFLMPPVVPNNPWHIQTPGPFRWILGFHRIFDSRCEIYISRRSESRNQNVPKHVRWLISVCPEVYEKSLSRS